MFARYALVIMSLFVAAPAAAQPCADLDRTHAAFTKLLDAHVKRGLVDYAGLQRDVAKLDGYLTSLERVCQRNYNALGEMDKLAFWLNLYNAHTLKLVISRMPFARVTDLEGGKVFDKPLAKVNVMGSAETLALNTIENERIRKTFGEPRIHFALVCAAKSCPPLRSEAYRGSDVAAQLEDQTKRFLLDPTKNRHDAKLNKLVVSKIFAWYRADFDAAGGIAAFAARYLGSAAKTAAVDFQEYDWALNGI